MRKFIVIFNILIFTLGITGCSSENAFNNKNGDLVAAETNSTNLSTQTGSSNGVLVETNSNDWIFLDGKSIIEGKSKEMKCDLNGDGNYESFSISRDNPNGTKVLGIGNEVGVNFAYDNSLYEAFDDFGEINEDYGYQMTCYDLDNDGIKEVIVSIGNQRYEMQSSIYSFIGNRDNPFILIGNIDGQEKMYIGDNGSIEVSFGSQGLFTEYKYIDSNLYEVDPNGTLKVVEAISFNEGEGEENFEMFEMSEGPNDNTITNTETKTIHIGDIVSTPGYVTKMIGEVTSTANGKYKVYWYQCIDLAGAEVTEQDLIRMSEMVSGITLNSSSWCEEGKLKVVSSAY